MINHNEEEKKYIFIYIFCTPHNLLSYLDCHLPLYQAGQFSLQVYGPLRSAPRFTETQFSSVQFNRLVVSDCLGLHELQHARPPCPSPTPGAYPDSCPLSW